MELGSGLGTGYAGKADRRGVEGDERANRFNTDEEVSTVDGECAFTEVERGNRGVDDGDGGAESEERGEDDPEAETMRYLFDLGHPAHYHLYKNTIKTLIQRGDNVIITYRERPILNELLETESAKKKIVGKRQSNIFLKLLQIPLISLRIIKLVKNDPPDAIISAGSPYAAFAASIMGVPHITFIDSEPEWINTAILRPFTNYIIVPSSYRGTISSKKQISVNSFKELAYLHPHYFVPDEGVLTIQGIRHGQVFAVVRLVSWTAHHDIGKHGINDIDLEKIVKSLAPHMKVVICSERDINEIPNAVRFDVAPNKLHDLLSYSSLFVCDSQTMATEAACLGIPTVRINSFVGNMDMGNFIELEQKYNLLSNFANIDEAIEKITEIISDPTSKNIYLLRRNELLKDKIDLTAFILDLLNKLGGITRTTSD